MNQKFAEYKTFDLAHINKEILTLWNEGNIFEKSIQLRASSPSFVFYEGPPSANGIPGIHHVMARTIKDVVCRAKTMQSFKVNRKAGWDTHGLPVELGVEKSLGITKEDIGKKISVAEYNQRCKTDVMKYTDMWEDITMKIGYWIDMQHPYITYENKYIESLWWALKELFNKGLLYKGYTIQPFSPAAGTGLSSHELNQPGCYKDVVDLTCIAQFKVVRNDLSEKFFDQLDSDLFFLAWTTTPWTLPSNTGLALGKNIEYSFVRTFNAYSHKPVTVILATELMNKYFHTENSHIALDAYNPGEKIIPFKVVKSALGSDLAGLRYEQLIPWHQPEDGDSFNTVLGDFVSTQDGTAIVHIAPSFGADDFQMLKLHGLGNLTLVDRQGKFVEGCANFSGRYVKNAYDNNLSEKDPSVDVDIVVMLKHQNKCFKSEKHTHSYPHCWRTDKPILYYPLDSWFIKTSSVKERFVELNKEINWKPESTGTGRFGKWLENLQDWNLSRSRYWGTPLPLWVSEDGEENLCIGSVEELKNEIEKSIAAGFMTENPLKDFQPHNFSKENYDHFDLHKPFVDQIVLVSASGKKLHRESDLIDVWFDSGSMPFAQIHYPFENKEIFKNYFPADFIAEGVDQTRGWFFTLHALSSMLFDSVAFKNVVSNGLVLDKVGLKMSKRLGNAVDPFQLIDKFGADPIRWYMIANAPAWDNLKFDTEGVEEAKRKFFGTLYNTYSFFALYANVDGFCYSEAEIEHREKPEIDRWILSLLNTLIQDVLNAYNQYELTDAARAIQTFVSDHLSNWYVRLNRKRFWGGQYDNYKIAAFQTLYQCLETVAMIASPIAPFFMDKLFRDLNDVAKRKSAESVHLTIFPSVNEKHIDKSLEERMDIAQKISSLVLSLRKKENIKVRQPLQKILIPIIDNSLSHKIEAVKDIILTEVNIKEINYISDTEGVLIKKIKPNFKTLGPKYGKLMKEIQTEILKFSQKDIQAFEKEGKYKLTIQQQEIEIVKEDCEILSEDLPGLLVASEGSLTVALDIHITEELKDEGFARELINRIQNLRKDSGFDVTDKIELFIKKHEVIIGAVQNFGDFIAAQTLAKNIQFVDFVEPQDSKLFIKETEMDDEILIMIGIKKIEQV